MIKWCEVNPEEERYKVDVCEGEFMIDSFDGNDNYAWGTEYSCSNCGAVLSSCDKPERCRCCNVLLDWDIEEDE